MSNQNATLSRPSTGLLQQTADVPRPRRTGLSRLTEARLRAKQRRRCPSAPWVDAQFKSIDSTDHRGRPIVCRYHDPSIFPPGGNQTAMIKCPACGVLTPPNAFEAGICMDERKPTDSLESHLGWGRSPSALSIEKIRALRQRRPTLSLRPESTAALKQEIERAKLKAQKALARKKRNQKRRVLCEE